MSPVEVFANMIKIFDWQMLLHMTYTWQHSKSLRRLASFPFLLQLQLLPASIFSSNQKLEPRKADEKAMTSLQKQA